MVKGVAPTWGLVTVDELYKHLQLIQAVVSRLAQNSFALKGWAVTLVSAVLVLAATKGLEPRFILVALLPAFLFWGLDGYYLHQERLFRKWYDAVRLGKAPADAGPFSMTTSPVRGDAPGWWRTCWSATIGWLYGFLVVLIILTSLLASTIKTG